MIPLVLVILDGWGYSPDVEGNAIVAAHPEFIVGLEEQYSRTLVQTAGEAVGLPEGQIGNSEIGHMCIGAGRIVPTLLERINSSVSEGTLAANTEIAGLFRIVRERSSTLHFMGL